MILQLVLIHLIVLMIFHSGFIDSIDSAINRRWKFRHLPKPFSCQLCSTFWASAIWLICTGQFSLITLTLSLTSAILTNITTPLLKTIENYLLKIIEIMNRLCE